MSIGDINSEARGTGARINDGKPPVELLLFKTMAGMLPSVDGPAERARLAMDSLGWFQEARDMHALRDVVGILYRGDWRQAAFECARVFSYGAKKYKAWNWTKGMPWSVVVACAGRHLLAIYHGEERDAESGEPHRGHVVCNVMMLWAYQERFPEGDDLPKLGGQVDVSGLSLAPIGNASEEVQKCQSQRSETLKS